MHVLKNNIPARDHVIALFILCVGGVLVGWCAWNAADTKPTPHPKDFCISCHSDAKTLAAMRDKQGIEPDAAGQDWHKNAYQHISQVRRKAVAQQSGAPH